MSKNEKKSFILYHSFANQFALLSMEERGQLISAIFSYERTGAIEGELSPLVNMAFSCMKESLDRDRESYESKCEQNAKNGQKGGRPRKDSSLQKTERFLEEPKKADNENGNGNGNENENDNVNDADTEYEEGEDTECDSVAYRTWETCADAWGEAPPLAESMDFSLESPPFAQLAPQFAPPTDPLLSEEARERLLEKGLPEKYVNERVGRAEAFAEARGKDAYEVLLSWWRDDRAKPPWNNHRPQKKQEHPKEGDFGYSFDTDDFFEAAIKRSFRDLGLTDS